MDSIAAAQQLVGGALSEPDANKLTVVITLIILHYNTKNTGHFLWGYSNPPKRCLNISEEKQ